MPTSMHWRVMLLLLASSLWHDKGRSLLSLIGITLGVALGVAVHLTNTAVLNEFTGAVRTLSGSADLEIRGPRGGFDEALYPDLARLPGVALASPAVEIDAKIVGQTESLKIMGIDPFRAGRLQPALIAGGQGLWKERFDALQPDRILLSPAAAAWLKVAPGGKIGVQVGLSMVSLTVAGLLPATGVAQRLGVMDIAGAQWLFQRLGRLNRIDLQLKPGVNVEHFQSELQLRLPPGLQAARPEQTETRATNPSRAYRVNLTMLAQIALFTGAFLVFSTQALSVVRRRAQLAFLRVIGVTRRALVALLIGEGALLGVLGAGLGLAIGYGLAKAALAVFGGNLGMAYFQSVEPALQVNFATLATFFVMGVAVAALGGLAPALEVAATAPAPALKAGDASRPLGKLATTWPGALSIAAGALATQANPVNGIPLFGYLAIALILLGALMLMPRLASVLFALLPLPRAAPAQLALAQLRAAPGEAAISLAAILVSVALAVAMAIMVASFRQSVDNWLDRMLPAELYLRAARSGESGFLSPADQAAIARLPGIARVEFLRAQNIVLDAERPPVSLIARPIDAANVQQRLALVTAPVLPAPGQPPPLWVSEAAADLYGLQVGERVSLPIAGRQVAFTVAGLWRDYARQFGALLIDLNLYRQLSGDSNANDAALWLAPGHTAGAVTAALRQTLAGAQQLEIAEPGEIRALSLRIFDRTFAVTYGLEAVAVLIGLFGIGASFGSLVLARRREFGMLRHIGMGRGQIAAMLACEGMLVSALGVAVGTLLGWVISLILIFVVNRQSFHWSMDLSIPWESLVIFCAALIAAATLTALWSGRQAMRGEVVHAVREDW